MDDTWAKLTHNIREIQYHRAHTLSFEENYRFAYQMVIMKNGKQLYEGTVDLVVENLERLVKEILQPNFPTSLDQDPMQRAHDDARLLSALSEVWLDHKGSMDKIGSILKYMVCYIISIHPLPPTMRHTGPGMDKGRAPT